jgi:hypothetical protein
MTKVFVRGPANGPNGASNTAMVNYPALECILSFLIVVTLMELMGADFN